MFSNLSGWHALVILTIVLLVFGSAKLPLLARSVGQSVRILKSEVHDDATTSATPAATATDTSNDTATPTLAEARPAERAAS